MSCGEKLAFIGEQKRESVYNELRNSDWWIVY